MSRDVIDQFYLLFQGSVEAVGTEDGGCHRLKMDNDFYSCIKEHLEGTFPIGIYPMTTIIDDDETTLGSTYGPWRWVVKWGCIDFDEGDEVSWTHAVNVHYVLKELGVVSYIERSRSKGYHVWVFCETWSKPEYVRYALMAACQIAGAPTKEINPKQTELRRGQLGNYVRLPYPSALRADPVEDMVYPRRVVVDTDGLGLSLGAFLRTVQAVPESLLEDVAAYYVRPNVIMPDRNWSQLNGSAVDRLRGKTRIIFYNGPLANQAGSETGFRGHTLWKLACYLAEDGQHTPEEALDLLRDADVRWGKFSIRRDGEQRLQQMIDRAFSRSE